MKYKITDPKIVLAKHQLDAVDFILTRDRSLINYETGTGKTFISLEAAFRMFNENKLDKVLIVCTKSSVLSFEGDIKSTNYPKEDLIIIKKDEDLDLLDDEKNKLFVIQYETLQRITLIDLMRAFKYYRSGLVIDEVHRVKTHGKFTKGGKSKESITAASLGALRKGFKILIGLTATTITSELEDGYRVINFIAPGVLGGLKWFEDNFCVWQEGKRWNPKARKYVGFRKCIRYKNLKKFLSYTKEIMIQYFPKLDYRFHVLSKSLKEGSKRALKYEELAKSTHATKKKKHKNNHSSVMPKLQRLIDKSPAKKFLLKKLIARCRQDGLIVYSRTRQASMLEYIQEILEEEGLQVKVICGSTKKAQREAIQQWAFEGEPTDKALVITDAAGQSMNLQYTHNLIFWEIPMGIGKFLQIKGRIGRMFSRWKWYDFYFLLIKNTIDEYWYLKFTSNKELMAETADDVAIPTSKMNKFDERKLKKNRNALVWRKGVNEGKKFENVDYQPSATMKIKNSKRMNGLTQDAYRTRR